MAGDIDSQLQTAPHTQLIEGIAQVVLYHLLSCANAGCNLAVGQAFPDQCCDLQFLCGQPLTGLHDFICSFTNMAVASFTRLRPSRMPARKKSVRRCCFTVRGLMFSWAAISLLLHPWTNSFNTCSSRCVIFIVVRSNNMVLPR